MSRAQQAVIKHPIITAITPSPSLAQSPQPSQFPQLHKSPQPPGGKLMYTGQQSKVESEHVVLRSVTVLLATDAHAVFEALLAVASLF